MKRITRILSLVLALATLFSLAACGGGTAEAAATTAAQTDETTTAPAETELLPNLPDKKYGGKDYRIVIRELTSYEFAADEMNGEIINDAVYTRNQKVNDQFDVNIKVIQLGGWSSESSEMLASVKNSITAGDDAYDLVLGYQAFVVNMAMMGFFYNWYEVPYVNLEMPWWSQKAVEILTLDDCMYILTGDISISVWKSMYVLFFNKEVAKQNKIPDLYELVRSGKWYYDDWVKMCADVASDLDGDGQMGSGDRYGLITCLANHIRQFMVSLDTPITTPGADGYPVLTFNNQKSIDVLNKINALYWAKSTYHTRELQEPSATAVSDVFLNDRALFMSAFLGNAELLRDMDTDFGIIPYPKYDENQAEYYTGVHNSVSTVLIPVTVKDIDMCGALTESLCYEGYKNIVPQYYEVVLKTKYARDEESSEMLDIIRAGMSFNFGWVHSVPMNSIGAFYSDLVEKDSTDFASSYSSKEAALKSKLAEIVTKYKEAKAKQK